MSSINGSGGQPVNPNVSPDTLQITNPNSAAAVQARVQGMIKDLEGMGKDLDALIEELNGVSAQLDAMQQNKPKEPGVLATPAERAAYKKAVEAWNGQTKALVERLVGLIQKIVEKKEAIDQKSGELTVLSQQKLPEAMRKDVEAVQRQVEAGRKRADDTINNARRAAGTELERWEDDDRRKKEGILKTPAPSGAGVPPINLP